MDVVLGIVLGAALTASVVAGARLALRPRRVLSPAGESMQAALHAAYATLPHLRQGLTERTAARAVPHVRTLTQSEAVALVAHGEVLATCGALEATGAPVLAGADRVEVFAAPPPGLTGPGLGASVAAPLLVGDAPVGALVASFGSGRRLEPEDTRVVVEAASLVSAHVELSVVAAQGERLARAELRALRAQISPHFIYNALAAVANYVHTRPDEARELLIEFAEFTRYAFREERKHVTLADELRYVEKYLRLEQARFGERLRVRVEVAPEVLAAVVPVLSLQPLVENAIRHGVESRAGGGCVELVGNDLGGDVEIVVRDDGPGIAPDRVDALLAGEAGGGIGLANVHARLRGTFGEDYGLTISPSSNGGAEVTMTVPKFRAGVRAA